MEVTEERKKQIEKMIVDSAIDALGAGVIEEKDLQPIAQFVLTRIDDIGMQDQLVSFLNELAGKWPFFLPIERFLEEEVKHEEEQKSVNRAEDLVKQGFIDQALEVLKETQKGEI